jgi:hypothetical protein
LPLQIFDQVWEPTHFNLAIHELPERYRWNAHHGSFLGDGTDDPGSRVNHGIIAQGHMIGHSRLATDHDTIANGGAAPQSNLGNDQTIASGDHVVADLDEIIELGTTSDSRFPERPSIDTGSRSDFDIVLDDDVSQ